MAANQWFSNEKKTTRKTIDTKQKDATKQQNEFGDPSKYFMQTCEAKTNKYTGPTGVANEEIRSPKILQHTETNN